MRVKVIDCGEVGVLFHSDSKVEGRQMTQTAQLFVMCVWTSIASFVSLLYLTHSFVKSAIIGLFVLISGMVGLGRRWVFRGGFLLAVLAIAVYVGLVPPRDEWGNQFKAMHTFVVNIAP